MKQLLFALIISNFFSTNIIAQEDLTGLKYIGVLVILSERLENEGYDSETIKTDTELALRLADIKVIDPGQYTSDKFNKTATINIHVTALVNKKSYLFNVELVVFELVTLPRLNINDYQAITWRISTLGRTPSGYEGWQFIRESAKGLVNNFLNNYLRDNPKN